MKRKRERIFSNFMTLILNGEKKKNFTPLKFTLAWLEMMKIISSLSGRMSLKIIIELFVYSLGSLCEYFVTYVEGKKLSRGYILPHCYKTQFVTTTWHIKSRVLLRKSIRESSSKKKYEKRKKEFFWHEYFY